jgi:multimeric flavodoxin WrbA
MVSGAVGKNIGDEIVKITIINGSPRKNGATNKILKRLSENIRKENPDAEINHIDLIDIKPSFCMGCQNCYKTGKCVITTDRMEDVHDLLEQSDGIIFGSPTYSCNVSGLFKVFHSRVHMTEEQLLYKKPCVLVTTCEITGAKKTLSIMRERILTAGGYTSGSIGVAIPFNGNHINEKTNAKIERIARKFVNNIKTNKWPLFARFYTYVAVNMFFKPFAMQHSEQYDAVIKSWEKKGLFKPRNATIRIE